MERPAHLQCNHVLQVPSQKIDSWPSEVGEGSLMTSSQTGQIKDLLGGFLRTDLLASVEPTSTLFPPFLELISTARVYIAPDTHYKDTNTLQYYWMSTGNHVESFVV